MADSAEVYDTALEYPDETEWLAAGTDIQVLLLKAAGPPTFDATHATVSAVLGHANNTELTDASYGRVAVAETGRNVNNGTRSIELRFDAAVDFTTLDAETVGAALVFEQVTTDADSIPLTMVTFDPDLVANGAGFTVGGVNSVVISRTGVTNP